MTSRISTRGEIRELLDGLKSWCLQESIVSCYLRLHPTMDQISWVNGATRRADTQVLVHCPTTAIDLSQWDTVNNHIAGMNRRRRRDLSKAQNQKLKATWSTSGIEQFQELYARAMDRLHAKEWCRFSPEYFQVLTTRLPNKWHILSVHRQECLVGMALNLFDSLYLHAHLIGITEEGAALGASTFVHNQAAEWGRSHGVRGFHMGSGRTEGDSLDNFKSSFGGIRYPSSSVGLIADDDAYATLCGLRREQTSLPEPRSNFFPAYRA